MDQQGNVSNFVNDVETTLMIRTSRGKWPSTVQVYESAPSGSWQALPRGAVLQLMRDNVDIDPVPVNRSTIFHVLCGQVHAPEQCRGPLDRGVLNGCLYCGGKDHLTDIYNELSRLPGPDNTLRHWANHGPLPNRKPSAREDVVEKHHDLVDYSPKEDAPMYNQWWTMFVNDFVPGPLPPKVVELPAWVTSYAGMPLGFITPYNKDPLPRESRRETLAPGSRNFNIRGAANQTPSGLGRFDAIHNFGQAGENSHGPAAGRVDTIHNFGTQAGGQSHGPVAGRVLKAESPDRVVKKEESPF
ncbi:hypothetical protein LQW54_002596 [Pestalotiopsis sp. IQ-011]